MTAYTDNLQPETDPGSAVKKAIGFYSDASDTLYRKAFSVAKRALEKLPDKEFTTWIETGKRILEQTAGYEELTLAFLYTSPVFFREEGIGYITTWGDGGLKLFSYSAFVATAFFTSTPEFLEHSRYTQLNQRVLDSIRILDVNDNRETTAAAFLSTGAKVHRYLSPRVYTLWKETGFLFARLGRTEAESYFSIEPDAIDRLYLSEITKILKITTSAVKESPEKALAFYQSAPGRLLKINPNIRDIVLEKSFELASGKSLISSGRFSSSVGKFSGNKNASKGITGSFEDISDALASFSNPVQEVIFSHQRDISAISQTACISYFKSVSTLLEKVPAKFLGNWVQKGIGILNTDRDAGIQYFQLESSLAESEASKWKDAALLEDLKQMLAVYAHGMSGEKVRVKNLAEIEISLKNGLGIVKEIDGYIFYLPDYIAAGSSYKENFNLYKIAAAVKAGYIEFGTLDPKFSGIWILLEKFPFKELALTIFHIIEDGRIYYQLKKNYKGLSSQIEKHLSQMVEKRNWPVRHDISGALEILLRLSIDCFDSRNIPVLLKETGETLCPLMDGFPESATGVLDSYRRTIDVYRAISDLQTTDRTGHEFAPLPLNETSDSQEDPSSGNVDKLPDDITAGEANDETGAFDLSDEDLAKLLDSVQDITLISLLESCASARGLYLSDIDNYEIKKEETDLRSDESIQHGRGIHPPKMLSRVRQKGHYAYDEWDFNAGIYRSRWCRLKEREIRHYDSSLYKQIYADQSDLIRKVRLQFQRIRPESLDIVHAVDQGDEIDLNALIENRVDKRAGTTPSDRIFMRKEKRLRHVSTLLLVDMSASTGETVSDSVKSNDGDKVTDEKRIVDIEIESLVVISEALDALGDNYAMYGFSGRGKDEVDYYIIKEFEEQNSEAVKMRISGIEPKQSTRMGTAIRHATAKLKRLDSEHRVMLILSDGFPQDLDYGEDRNSKEYGLADTMMALIEAKREGIRPFCITVDQAGNDYLKKMCDPKNYLIIKEIHMLPEILPGVVESLMCS